jgi:DNA-binding MarR family transcriptional regulator
MQRRTAAKRKVVTRRLSRRDAVPEAWLSHWYAVRPDIDPLGIAILGRIIRLGPAFESHRAAVLASLGLTPEVSDLIISLLRRGPPHELPAGSLSPESTFPLSTSGGMTYRVDSAEKLGLVNRRHDDKDRRSVIVSLTKKGLDLANRDVDMHMELVARLLGEFSNVDRSTLARLLQRLLKGLEAPSVRLIC